MGTMRVLAVLAFIALTSAYTKNYHGNQVWRVDNVTKESAESLRGLIDTWQLDVWSSGDTWVDIQVSPENLLSLGRTLTREGFEYKVQVKDLQSLIENELKTLSKAEKTQDIDLTNYHELSEIEAYMSELANTYDWVTLKSIGKTLENRDLWVTILAAPGSQTKPSIWIDCGIHAREWITPATCIYGLNYLTSGYSVVDEVTQFLDKYDLYIMPVHNPDGYSYTWTNDRVWRKNRRDNLDGCFGVDLNRNFDDGHWGGIGSSDSTCSSTYHGPEAFSELESQAVRDYTTGLVSTNNLMAYYTIHSYSQVWMYAYGWTADYTPEDDQLAAASKIGVDALTAVHDTLFDYGTIYHAIYPASGTSIDWGYSVGIVHTYTLELRDTGEFGFLLPAEQIVPTGEETWAGLIASIMSL